MTDFNDLHQIAGLETVREQISAALSGRSEPDDDLYPLLSMDNAVLLPEPEWRVKGLFPERGTGAIYGPSGSGKSFLGFDLACAISSGRDWFGHQVKPAPVVYLWLEGQFGLKTRVAAYRAHYSGDALADVRFIVLPFDILNGGPEKLIRTVKKAGLENPVILIDTLNRAAQGADENSGVDMGRIIEATQRIQAQLDGLVILIHHSGKDTAKGMRGHSSLHAALDAVITVKREGEIRKWSTNQAAGGKVKDGSDGIEHIFTLKVCELGRDKDGDPITSCVILPDDPKNPDQTKRKSLGKYAAQALCILKDLYQQRRANLAESGNPPDTVRVSFADWAAEMKDLPRNRASEARKEVLDKGYAVQIDSHVLPVPSGSDPVPPGTNRNAVHVPSGSGFPIGNRNGTEHRNTDNQTDPPPTPRRVIIDPLKGEVDDPLKSETQYGQRREARRTVRTVEGESPQVVLSPERRKVYDLIVQHGPIQGRDITSRLHPSIAITRDSKEWVSVRKIVRPLEKAGLILKTSQGYRVQGTHPLDN